MNVAEHIVNILEERGVKFVFGMPGEENIALVNALHKSDKIQFILVQDERSGAFMAGTIGWLTGKPGVVIATLGPGALNMVLSVADAHTHSFPLIAIAAQGEIESRIRETTQVIDLKDVYQSITKWSEDLVYVESTTELINKAYNLSVSERKGATFVTIPANLEKESLAESKPQVIASPKVETVAANAQLEEAAQMIRHSEKPIVVAGLGVSRENIGEELRNFIQKHQLPLATSYMAKGVISENSELSLGVVGFFVRDYVSDYLEEVDVILTIGYDFAEFEPTVINPAGDKKIINLHTFDQETHEHFAMDVQLIGDMTANINQLSNVLADFQADSRENTVRPKLNKEYDAGKENSPAPLTPVQIVHATRQALPDQGKVLIDTGAVKMWMARLFPAYELNTVLINNALSTMAWAIPGAIAAKLIEPDTPLLIVVGDGAFHMSAADIATAVKYDIPLTILIWDDSGYGLIKWKMEMDLDEYAEVDFTNPDFTKIAEAFGGSGYVVGSRDELESMLKESLEKDNGIDIIVAPVDYGENMKLTEMLESTE